MKNLLAKDDGRAGWNGGGPLFGNWSQTPVLVFAVGGHMLLGDREICGKLLSAKTLLTSYPAMRLARSLFLRNSMLSVI